MSRTPLFRAVQRTLSQVVREEAERQGIQFTRRQGLKYAGGAALAAYLNACKSLPGNDGSELAGVKKKDRGDGSIAIIGGGAAGLSALYYLRKAGIEAHCYEATNRLGGRIFTQYNFNEEKMFCERGGELIDTGHKEIQNLMQDLGLELERLPDDNLPSEVHFFGGFKSHDQLLEGFRPFAKVLAKDAAEFLVKGEFTMPTYKNPISKRVKELDQLSLKAYLDDFQAKVDKGTIKTNEVEKKNVPWVLNLIRVAYVGEYGLEAEQQSSINLISFIGTDPNEFKVFGESDELFRVKGGNSMLIKRLSTETQGAYSLDHYLKEIAKTRDGFQLLFNVKGKVVEVKAETVIMTLPFSVLRNVAGINKLGLSDCKLRAIRTLGYGTNTKLMMGFKSRYWRNQVPSEGNPNELAFPPSDGAVLSDLEFQGGWDTSRKQDGKSGIFTNFIGGNHGVNFTEAKIDKTLADLKKVFQGIGAQYDKKWALQAWPEIETARGSYICPTVGQYTSIGGCFGETECNGALLFAGEHTSEEAAGFMSGAVESGLRAATELIEVRGDKKKRA